MNFIIKKKEQIFWDSTKVKAIKKNSILSSLLFLFKDQFVT